MNDRINYLFHKEKQFFTLQKDYRLRFQKTPEEILITKYEVKNNPETKQYRVDNKERFAGKISVGGVWNQLANIRQIVFEVTDACNLQCTYCAYGKFYDDYDKRENQYIDIHRAKLLIDEVIARLTSFANTSQCKKVMISFYGGEPLLNMDFIQKIVEYIQQKNNSRIKFHYNMTTNGVYLKKWINFLIRYDFQLLVSLDGSEANDSYRKFHNGKSSFKIVYENLLYIQSNYLEFFKKRISFNAVLHNLNNEQEAFTFFKQQFNKVPLFSDISDKGVRENMQQKFAAMIKQRETSPDLNDEMQKELGLNSAISQSLSHFIFRYSGNVYKTYNSLLQRTESIKYIPSGTCFPFSKKIYMTVTGKLLPCERIGHQFALGKVTENGVEIDCEKVADMYNNYYDRLRKQCINCYQVGNCSQCMFHVKNLETIPACPGFMTKSNFENYLQAKLNQLSRQPEIYKQIMEEFFIAD
ncbi:MAG: radical SAM peptide maturase [Bacteroidales bacterium]|jgi:uncharacterized protein|nr:radical SAM peptide maturase [Bacteroidales bacterium]